MINNSRILGRLSPNKPVEDQTQKGQQIEFSNVDQDFRKATGGRSPRNVDLFQSAPAVIIERHKKV